MTIEWERTELGCVSTLSCAGEAARLCRGLAGMRAEVSSSGGPLTAASLVFLAEPLPESGSVSFTFLNWSSIAGPDVTPAGVKTRPVTVTCEESDLKPELTRAAIFCERASFPDARPRRTERLMSGV